MRISCAVKTADDRGPKAVDVEALDAAVVVQILEQIEAGEIAAGVVEMEVLGTRIAGGDAPGVGRRVPTVDRRVELHTRVGTLPGGSGDLAKQVPRRKALDRHDHRAEPAIAIRCRRPLPA